MVLGEFGGGVQQLTVNGPIDATGGLTVDVEGVTFMDSSGVSTLAGAHQSVPARLRLGPVHPRVRQVLEITGLVDVFSIFDTVEQAVQD